MNEVEVRNWFGNRGYPFSDKSKLKFKVIGDWIFIHDSLDEYDEVELYYMDTIHAEPYDGWTRKGFSWAKEKLLTLIPRHWNQGINNGEKNE